VLDSAITWRHRRQQPAPVSSVFRCVSIYRGTACWWLLKPSRASVRRSRSQLALPECVIDLACLPSFGFQCCLRGVTLAVTVWRGTHWSTPPRQRHRRRAAPGRPTPRRTRHGV